MAYKRYPEEFMDQAVQLCLAEDANRKEIADSLRAIANADVVSLFEKDPFNDEFTHSHVFSGHLRNPSARGRGKFFLNVSIVGEVMNQDEDYIYLPDVPQSKWSSRPFAVQERIKTCLAFKLSYDNQVVGVIFINYKKNRELDHSMVELLQSLVNVSAALIYTELAKQNAENKNMATVFGYYVNDPERYGVAEFDSEDNVISIEEKPVKPKSNFAVVGLYFYTNDVVQIAKKIKPSHRGELEITTVNQEYLKQKKLKVQLMGRGFAWLDTGTHDSLMEAGQFIETIEKRQGLKVACLEEIAYSMGYIDAQKIKELAEPLKKNGYGQYLLNLIK